MRARHRHFNPKGTGAVLALDSRFITGLADGANVSTWTSRTGSNNATQATSGNQPTYETNELNGNPVVLFNGSKVMTTPGLSAQPMSVVCIARHNTGTSYIFDGVSNNRAALGSGLSTGSSNSKMESFAGTTVYGADQSFNTGEYFIWRTIFNDSSSSISKNGSSFASGNPGTQSLSGGMTIGNRFALSFYLNGAIAFINVIPSVSVTLLKRLEQVAAFSFKIPCS